MNEKRDFFKKSSVFKIWFEQQEFRPDDYISEPFPDGQEQLREYYFFGNQREGWTIVSDSIYGSDESIIEYSHNIDEAIDFFVDFLTEEELDNIYKRILKGE